MPIRFSRRDFLWQEIWQLHAEPVARRLCGWSSARQIPFETGFSNANREFAERGFTEQWFEDVVVRNHGDVHVDTISYDSVPIKVRARTANVRKVLAEIDPDQPVPRTTASNASSRRTRRPAWRNFPGNASGGRSRNRRRHLRPSCASRAR